MDPRRTPPVSLPIGPEGQQQLRNQLEQLFPYTGNLWQVPYALNGDYDLMLTAWGRFARGLNRGLSGSALHSGQGRLQPVEQEIVRLMMALKLASLAQGASGVRLETLDLAQDAGLKAAGPPPIGLWVRGEPDLAAATAAMVAAGRG